MRHNFDLKHPNALAVYCSDGRFTGAIEEHMRSLGHARFDTLTVPGGPAMLHMGGMASVMHVDGIRNAAQFIAQGHGIKHVVLFAHESCGWYRSKTSHLGDAAAICEDQRSNMKLGARWVWNSLGIDDVRCFYARATVDQMGIVFDEVSK